VKRVVIGLRFNTGGDSVSDAQPWKAYARWRGRRRDRSIDSDQVHQTPRMSLTFASWNRIAEWMRALDGVRKAS
jgi:hypothetical protein